ncbi:MAG: 2-oxoglutarate dehydrogenase component, partial [Bacteroidota bacterium]
ALDALINRSAIFGTKEVTIGMAHRGRLNVLCNILGKTYKQVLGEFEGKFANEGQMMGSGDVKYHLGFSSQITTFEGNKVYLKLLPNPSHLECAAPVVQGYTRAKIDLKYNGNVNDVLPITIHGDAAVAGQGVVYETLQMAGLEGYHTGGTVHFVINNQIGFTTVFEDARTGNYCTSLAAMTNSPVLHVNGNDPEAVVWAMEFAADYRQTFHNDIFIDMVCYRKWGHNEGEDAGYTNLRIFKELLVNYKDIKDYYEKENPRDLYASRLIAEKVISEEQLEAMKSIFREHRQHDLDDIKQNKLDYTYQEGERAWKELKRDAFSASDFTKSPETAVNRAVIEQILTHINRKPEGYNIYDKVDRLLKALTKSIELDKLDWGTGELLAYATLLLEGYDVRMSGQDVKRGTFSHRQSVFFDTKDEREYNRISDISENQGKFRIFNSLLAEFAVMGFEYGYSLANPKSLVIWEGQFGDFYNGAQTIVDQFVVAGETKWKRQSGLVLLLPHGMEGQGPEHSSGRIERFLQQCAEWNITVANASTPANMFHLLRRQQHRNFRKPLIVFTPKSLLRAESCTSSIADFTTGGFQEVIDDALFTPKTAKNAKRLILCSGKVYYDLAKKRSDDSRTDVAIVRLEQLYPFPQAQIDEILAKYKKAEVVWVQEEAENMGAARHLQATFRSDLRIIARPAAAAPAVGLMAMHKSQESELLAEAFNY